MSNLDHENGETTNVTIEKALSPANRNKWIIYIAILAIVNYALSTMFDGSGASHLSGEGVTPDEYKDAAIGTMLWGIPIISSILALLFNFIPYKNFNYSQRYLRTWLLIILTMHGAFLLLALRRLLM